MLAMRQVCRVQPHGRTVAGQFIHGGGDGLRQPAGDSSAPTPRATGIQSLLRSASRDRACLSPQRFPPTPTSFASQAPQTTQWRAVRQAGLMPDYLSDNLQMSRTYSRPTSRKVRPSPQLIRLFLPTQAGPQQIEINLDVRDQLKLAHC